MVEGVLQEQSRIRDNGSQFVRHPLRLVLAASARRLGSSIGQETHGTANHNGNILLDT